MFEMWAQALHEMFGRAPRVLVAEPDRYSREVILTALELMGCDLLTAPDGQRVWEAISQEQVDLLIASATLPSLDGLTLCRRLRATPHLSLLPVILTTVVDSDAERQRALEAGADELLVKPFSTLVLLTRVRSLLRIKHLHDLLEARNALLRQVLNRYLDAELASRILEDPERLLRLGGETRTVTVLFADIRHFTTFAERFPAQEVVNTLNRIFTALTEEIFRHQGTFDKYLGDAVMALFGAPLDLPNAPQQAVRTALAMQARFAELQANAPPYAPLRALSGLGIGIHTGEAVVGNIGSERIMDYTAVGDTVNIARRLQEMARPGEILVSEDTLRQVPDAVGIFVAQIGLPGRKEPLVVYRLQHLVSTPTPSAQR